MCQCSPQKPPNNQSQRFQRLVKHSGRKHNFSPHGKRERSWEQKPRPVSHPVQVLLPTLSASQTTGVLARFSQLLPLANYPLWPQRVSSPDGHTGLWMEFWECIIFSEECFCSSTNTSCLLRGKKKSFLRVTRCQRCQLGVGWSSGWSSLYWQTVDEKPKPLTWPEEFVSQDSFHCRFVAGYTVKMAFGPAAHNDASLFVLRSRPEGLWTSPIWLLWAGCRHLSWLSLPRKFPELLWITTTWSWWALLLP